MEISENTVSNRKPTILIVEDNSMNQMLLEIMLRRLRYEVCIVSSGQEALTLLREKPIDLVISDIMMPEMDGFELLQNIHSGSNSNPIPVILMTAGGRIALSGKALEKGADGFLCHPFSSIELDQMVSRLLHHLPVSLLRTESEVKI